MTEPRVELLPPEQAPPAVERTLRSVPDWFGIEESTRAYIAASRELPTWGVFVDDTDPVGFLTIKRHFQAAADIHCIAVHKSHHGRGVGTALVRHVEASLRAEGVQYLQVKTMGPSKPNAEYAMTLRFYLRAGFTPLEEVHGLWPGLPCLILVKRL